MNLLKKIVFIRKLEVDGFVILKRRVYFNEKKTNDDKDLNIIDYSNRLNDILPYVRLRNLRYSCVSFMINNMKTLQSLVAVAHYFDVPLIQC